MAKQSKRNAIQEQYVPHLVSMVASPAFRVLSLSERRVLDRLEVEHMKHGGVENGKLPCTYHDIEKWGVKSRFAAPALRALEALGFIVTTRQGYRGAAGKRMPSLYRLTFVRAQGDTGYGTLDYQRIKTIEEAEAVAKAAREATDERNVQRGKKSNLLPPLSGDERGPLSGAERGPLSGGRSGKIPPPLSGGTIYISDGNTGVSADRAAEGATFAAKPPDPGSKPHLAFSAGSVDRAGARRKICAGGRAPND
jgi:hypothetical protein